MKKVLVVSSCGKRRDTIGLIGWLLAALADLDKKEYHISLLDTDFFECNHMSTDYKVDSYHPLDKCIWDSFVRHIPRLRSIYAEQRAVCTYRRLITSESYDIVIVYQIPRFADKLVTIAHENGTKIVFEPFGSDILRVSGAVKDRLNNAFSNVDGVVGRTNSNVLIAAQNEYKVPQNKIKEQREIAGGVIRLKKQMGKLSRKEMHDEVGIPYSDYNIVCGYSGRESHRHREIIDALIAVKDVLPQNYQIVFPMTYGAGAHHELIINYAARLKTICDEAGLNTYFMTDFKSFEQIAYLHLITDLFIEIQPTDNGNAFMIESLYAQNQIVTGRWLNYKRFEQFGEPYFLIDRPEDLADKLREIFAGKIKKAKVPQELIDFFDVPEGYNRSEFWSDLFDEI